MGCIVANVKKILYICGVNLIIDVIVSSYLKKILLSSYLIVKSNQFTESRLSNNFRGLNHFNIMQRKL